MVSKEEVEVSAKKGEIEHNYANILKATETLGWKPTTSLEFGIQKTYDYLVENYKKIV